jgi:hypothetical protein
MRLRSMRSSGLRFNMTKRLIKARFDLFAIGTRQSPIHQIADELSYWSDLDENVVGVVFRDLVDNDYGWALMVRDRLGRFRSVDLEHSLKTERWTEARLRLKIADTARTADLAALGIQGDETNAPVDLLTVLPGTRPDQLHAYFRELIESPVREPARAVLREIGPWLTAADPHFVKEFQRHQFDQRLWELYLWAALREGGYDVLHGEAPDFRVRAPGVAFAVEATTVAPSKDGVLAEHPDPHTPEELNAFLAGYMPIKYGGSLTNKLNRRSAAGKAYWEEDDVAGLPFVIAVADFHKPASEDMLGSMTYTQSAIWPYLYGFTTDWEMVDGKLVITRRDLATHTFKGKTIESGFFNLPRADNVSAVLFSNAGTLAKFERIGILAGYRPANIKYMRAGFRYNPDPNATVGTYFFEDVGADGYSEGWADELQVFHNPRALRPLPMECFGPLAQHRLADGKIVTHYGTEAVLSSYTIILHPKADAGSSRRP